jgi:CBS domain-containing protein
MGLKLKAGLADMETNRPISGVIDVSQLTSLERDLLKDALGVVKHFKTLMRSRFRLDTL